MLPGVCIEEKSAGRLFLSNDTADTIGHGTACAHRILQMCPEAQLIPVKIFHDDLGATGNELNTALQWVLDQRVDIVNLSLTANDPETHGALLELCNQLNDAGVHIVAAADNVTGTGIPAELPFVFGVKAAPRRNMGYVGYNPITPIDCSANGFVMQAPWIGSFNSIAAATVSGFIGALTVHYGSMSQADLRALLSRLCISDGAGKSSSQNP